MKWFWLLATLAVVACAYSSGSGNISVSVNREVTLDGQIEVPSGAASDPAPGIRRK